MTKLEIDVRAEIPVEQDLIKLAKVAATAVLKHQKTTEPASLTILLADDIYVQQLNREYLGVNQPTDVLSFPVGDPMPGVSSYLGDIVVSMEAVGRQSVMNDHTLASELQLLVVHSVLHLLGYEHDTQEKQRIMWSVQEEVLVQLGAEVTRPAV